MKWSWLGVVLLLALQRTRATDSSDDAELLNDIILENIDSLDKDINLQRQLIVQLMRQSETRESVIASLQEKFNQTGTTPETSDPEISHDELKKSCPERIHPQISCTWLDSYGCYCFTFDKIYKTLDEATKFCRDNGMQLLSIETAGEQNKLIEILQKNLNGKVHYERDTWMSGSDEEEEGRWKWTATGQPIFYFNWKATTGEPNNFGGNEDVMVFSLDPPFQWLDYPRSRNDDVWERNFVCERSARALEDRLQILEQRLLAITAFDNVKICPSDIGAKSNCTKIQGLGCYCVSQLTKGRDDARQHCKNFQMDLVSIESEDEQLRLADFLRSVNPDHYITTLMTSGWDEKLDGNWRWTSTGQPITYKNWYPGNPNNNVPNSQALLLNGYYPYVWLNYPASDGRQSYFICES